jgi:hypothetical protein
MFTTPPIPVNSPYVPTTLNFSTCSDEEELMGNLSFL